MPRIFGSSIVYRILTPNWLPSPRAFLTDSGLVMKVDYNVCKTKFGDVFGDISDKRFSEKGMAGLVRSMVSGKALCQTRG